MFSAPMKYENVRFENPTDNPSYDVATEIPKQVNLYQLLPKQSVDKKGKKTLILDLDETLIHSSIFPFTQETHILLNVEIEKNRNLVHVLKRPGAEELLENVSKFFEVVIFTASLSEVNFKLINSPHEDDYSF